MKRYLFVTGTVTYAMKARDILNRKGFNARIERLTAAGVGNGCGYAVAVQNNPEQAYLLLKEYGIKVLNRIEETN